MHIARRSTLTSTMPDSMTSSSSMKTSIIATSSSSFNVTSQIVSATGPSFIAVETTLVTIETAIPNKESKF